MSEEGHGGPQARWGRSKPSLSQHGQYEMQYEAYIFYEFQTLSSSSLSHSDLHL
jgi:hypothetical protein